MTTLDGYDEGPHGEFDWPLVDDEFNQFAVDQLDEADTLLFGRTTYLGMRDYWPAVGDEDPIAARMNGYDKLVVSRTLTSTDWGNTRILADPIEVAPLREAAGRSIAVLGSSALTVSLLEHGLIDEVRVMVNPLILGAGRSVFHTSTSRWPLTLLDTRPFRSGNVLLTYRPAGKPAGALGSQE